jgi:hypothetical protein
LSQSLIETTTGKNKRVRKNSDDLDRARAISSELKQSLKDVQMVFAEVPVGSQSARAMASYGISIGVLSAIAKPMVQVTPSEVKIAAVNDKTASKEEMIAWAVDLYPDFDWLERGGKKLNKNEHIADAIAAIHAGIKSEQFLSAQALLFSMA